MARAHGDHALAQASYAAVLDALAGARGMYARPAEAVMAAAALALADLARADAGAALDYAAAALDHARRSGDVGLERRVRRLLSALAR
jgi:hypothetical protein